MAPNKALSIFSRSIQQPSSLKRFPSTKSNSNLFIKTHKPTQKPITAIRSISDLSSKRLPIQRSYFSTSTYHHASPTTTPASSFDPLEAESQRLIEEGSKLLERGDVEGSSRLYEQSISIKPSSTGYYNLGIALYQLKRLPEAISAWEKSLKDLKSSDVYTNLASAYILSDPPQPHKSLENLKKAVQLDPEDGEIRFNLAAVNEANGHLEDALAEYKQALQLGITRAQQNIRNVGAKLIRKKLNEDQREQKK